MPNVNARILNRLNRNIGSGTLVSIQQNTASTAQPPIIAVSTHGLVQPIVCAPYGWMP